MICGVFGACWGRVTVLTAGARATVITVIIGVRVWCVRSLGEPQCSCTGVEGNKRSCCCVRESCALLGPGGTTLIFSFPQELHQVRTSFSTQMYYFASLVRADTGNFAGIRAR